MQNKKTPAMRALYLLLALVIAVGVWFYVDNYGDNGGAFSAEQEVTEIPIEYIGADGLADRGLMLLEEGTSTSVDITFEGPRLLVARLDRSKVRLTADLSSVTAAGTQTVSYRLAFLDGQGRATTQASTRFSGVTAKEYSIDQSFGFPFTKKAHDIGKPYRSVVVPCTLATNVAKLHEKMFNEKNYSPSNTVSALSQQIISISGFNENSSEDYSRLEDNKGINTESTTENTTTQSGN